MKHVSGYPNAFENMEKQAKYIVVCGLSASGKTSLVKRWEEDCCNVVRVPDHAAFMRGTQLPRAPQSKQERRIKQEIILELDVLRNQWVCEKLEEGFFVISDKDFTSALAYNYAEHVTSKRCEIFHELLERYLAVIASRELIIADCYFFLDALVEARLVRRDNDKSRVRNPIFFERKFAEAQRNFYYHLLDKNACQQGLFGYVIDAQGDPFSVYQQSLSKSIPSTPTCHIKLSQSLMALV